MDGKTVHAEGEVIRLTDKAVLFHLKYENEPRWIPRSVIEDGDEVDEATTEIFVAQWWALKNDVPEGE